MIDPKNLNKKIQEILDKYDKGKYIFRGERECYDKVSSNLYRYYRKLYKTRGRPFDNHFPVSKLEKKIVDRARRHIRLDAPNIEVLTELQHHGGKTTLIDFTQNIYVALFFACNGSFDEDGRVILFSTSGIQKQTDIDYEKENEYTLISPTGKDPRVVFQSSVFLHASRGYIEESKYEIFEIEKDLKKEFLDYLRRYCGIENETIYNDIQGFIENQENYPDAEAEFYLGVTYHDKNLFAEAIEHYSEAIELNPQFAEAYFNRAVAKADLEKLQEAIEDYNQAIELKPKFAEAYVNRGNIKTRLGNLEEAIQDFDQALKLNSEHVEAYTNRGYTKTLLGRKEEAIEDYNQAIELKPDNETYTNRGSVKLAMSYPEESIKDFDKAIELNPKSPEAYYNRGLANYAMNYLEEAMKDFEKAAQLRPKHAETYINRGSMKATLGYLEEAIEDFDKAIALKPKSAKAHHNRGLAKRAMGKPEEAKKDFEKAEKFKSEEDNNNTIIPLTL
ncbi:MAG: tetratricopeptide repeat protein [Candidatus Dadabacteria bacterium]|nr:tetratricopeptide repeat protein [Candidatus Dadabacteria bacterium]